MDGFELVQAIESELKRRGISKAKFYEDTGISSATFSQWRKKIYAPSSAALVKLEEYLGIAFTIEQKEKPTLQTESEHIPGYSKLSETNRAIVDSMIAQLLAAQSED